MITQYLSQNFKLLDFQTSLTTAEFSKWMEEVNNLYKWIENKFSNDEGQTKINICSSIRDAILTLERSFFNITNTKLSVTSVQGVNISKYLNKIDPVSKQNFHHVYSEDLFNIFLKLEYSLLISRDGMIYSEQFKLASYKFLFSSFSTYYTTFENKTEWCFTIEEINNMIDNILSTDINELLEDKQIKKIKDELGFEYALNTALRNKEKMLAFEPEIKYLGKKPFNAQCLKDLWRDIDEREITQAGKMQLVMERYNCSKSTAINYMKEFGLWKGRKDSKTRKPTTAELECKIQELEDYIKKQNQKIIELQNMLPPITGADLFK